MRAQLWCDMEGMSRVTDHRQCWPAFPEYWQTGRRAFTDEVTAAALGLLDGGAERVYVVNAHGLGWPNLLWDYLPDRVEPADEGSLRDGSDAMFFIGFHARAGTTDGFISHTMVPGLAVFADDLPLTECHIWAWLQELPVLGVIGDRALGGQLDGFLDGTPFLPVKNSTSRAATTPAHAGHADSMAAIRQFADACARRLPSGSALPKDFSFSVALDPALAEPAEGVHGLHTIRPGVLAKDARTWRGDVQPALEAGIHAALQPLLAAQSDLDLRSEASMRSQDPAQLNRLRRYFTDWVTEAG